MLAQPALSKHEAMALLALCFSNAAESVEVLSAGYILGQVTTDKDLQTQVAVSVYVGMAIGGILSGAASDHLGRVGVLRTALGLGVLATLAVAVAPNFAVLIIGRWCSGFAVGAATPPLFALVPDLVPPEWSGFSITIVACFWMAGSLFAATLALAILPEPLGDTPQASSPWDWDSPWRMFSLACSAVPIAATLLVHCYVRQPAGMPSYPNAMSTPSSASCSPHAVKAAAGTSLQLLIEARRALLPLVLTWWGLCFGYYGLSTWISVLVADLKLGNTYLITLMYAAASAPGNVISVVLVYQFDRKPGWQLLGRKYLLVIGMGVAAVCALILAIFCSGSADHRDTGFIIVLVVLFNAFVTVGWNMLDCLSSESFNTISRGAAFGLLSAVGRLSSIVAQLTDGKLSTHIPVLFTVTSGFMAAGCLGALFLTVDRQTLGLLRNEQSAAPEAGCLEEAMAGNPAPRAQSQ